MQVQAQLQVQSGARVTARRGENRKAHSSLGVLSLSPRWEVPPTSYLYRTLEVGDPSSSNSFLFPFDILPPPR